MKSTKTPTLCFVPKNVYKDNSQVTSWCRFTSLWSPTFVLQVKKTNFPDKAFSVFIPSFPCAQAKGFQLLEENLLVQLSSVSFHSSPEWWERNLMYRVLLLFVSGVGICSLYESNVGVEEWQIVRDVVLLTYPMHLRPQRVCLTRSQRWTEKPKGESKETG